MAKQPPKQRATYRLSGHSIEGDKRTTPIRGDLADIKLAGKLFAPHYAVPMPHAVKAGGATLRKAGKADADALETLAAGALFDVLDMAGGWAWGQFGEDGPVGYVALAELEACSQ